MTRDTINSFIAFYRANPGVMIRLINTLRRTKAKGRESYSLRTLWHVLRWQMDMQGNEVYKLNDRYQSLFRR